MNKHTSLLVFMKQNIWTALAKQYLRNNFSEQIIIDHDFNRNIEFYLTLEDKPDWIISYLCPVKIPIELIKKAKNGAINFHPGPPAYPGIGCYNFALLNDAKEYGVTCHFMDEHFDSGPIIEVDYFSIENIENVQRLKEVSMMRLLTLFYRIMQDIYLDNKLVKAGIPWERPAYTRKDLQDLCKIPITFNTESIQGIERRLRATYFPGALDTPYITVNGQKWRLEPI